MLGKQYSMGAPRCFSTSFTKGNNFSDFLFASLDGKALPKWGLHLKERLCFHVQTDFHLEINRTVSSIGNMELNDLINHLFE